MRSIERRFSYVKKKNPYWSTFTCFAHTIRGKNFSKDRIKRFFKKLVNKKDYEKDDKRQILKYLYDITRDTL